MEEGSYRLGRCCLGTHLWFSMGWLPSFQRCRSGNQEPIQAVSFGGRSSRSCDVPLARPLYTCLKISAFQHFSTSPEATVSTQFACAQKALADWLTRRRAAVLTSQGEAGAC